VLPAPAPEAGFPVGWTGSGLLTAAVTAVLTLGAAAAALWSRRRAPRVVTGALGVLHRAHSGQVGDYVAWLLAGIAVLAGLAFL
jgi:multicomponent Na+:H+ antiporter subunit D